MPEGNGALYDDAVRRRIFLERYSAQQARKAARFLKDLEDDIVAKLATLRADGASALTRAQSEQLLASTRELSKDVYARLRSEIKADQRELATGQARYTSQSLEQAGAGLGIQTRGITATGAYAIASSRPMLGAFLKDWFRDLEPNARRRLERQLRISFAEGEDLTTAMRRIRQVTDLNRRGAETFLRTSNSHIASSVDTAVAEANSDIIKEVEWRSVLDSRTSAICMMRSGKRFPVDSGPRPPAHFQCRSTIIMVLDGVEPAPTETYAQWLKRQSAETQDDILGPTRGRAFRSGALTVDRFVDRTGRRRTLSELGLKAGGQSGKRRAVSPSPPTAPTPTAPPPPPPPPRPRRVGRGVEVIDQTPIHGMKRTQKMTRTMVGGIEVYEPASATYVRDLLTQNSLQMIAEGSVPKGLLYATNRIVLSRDRNRHDDYWAKKYKRPGFRSNATGGDGDIVVYGRSNKAQPLLDSTAVHEMGHNLQLRLTGNGGDPGPEYTALWRTAIDDPNAEQPVKEYGRVAATEDFSTAVELYALEPERFKARYPQRYAIIDRMVKQSEALGPMTGRAAVTDWTRDD